MSSRLVGIIRAIKVGPRLAAHKLALYALADDGKAVGEVEISAADIMEAAEMEDRQARKLRAAWQAMGLLTLTRQGGSGPHDQNGYRVNVALLEQFASGERSYAEAWRVFGAGGAIKGVPECHLPDPAAAGEHAPEKAALKEALKAAPKAALKEALGLQSSSMRLSLSIDDDGTGPAPVIPEWALMAVERLEPERWHVLAEVYLRWDGSRKAVDVGKAFVGWAKHMLGADRKRVNGKGTLEPGDWGRLYAMAGIATREDLAAAPADMARVRSSREKALAEAWRNRRKAAPPSAPPEFAFA